MTSYADEINFDALPGPTHFYGGFSEGNLPSTENRGIVSNPKACALQCLNKMKVLHDLGVKQAVLPPQERPHLPTLRAIGFSDTVEALLEAAALEEPSVLAEVSSSASMWAANSATVSPSIDCADKKVHFTYSNMASKLHRSIEAKTTERIFRAIFKNPVFFAHHSALPSVPDFWDEGGANHLRLAKSHHLPGVELFVYGSNPQDEEESFYKPKKYPARQSIKASRAVARLHTLYKGHAHFALQSPIAIDKGAFHNDLVAMSNLNLLILHEHAFARQNFVLEGLKRKVQDVCDQELIIIEIKEGEISLDEAIRTYLFNSQIVTLRDGSMSLIAPIECQQNGKIAAFLNALQKDSANPLSTVHFVDLKQSMQNGGGPACLRLRVVLNEEEQKEVLPTIFFSQALYERLTGIVNRFYPEHLTEKELSDPKLYETSCLALQEIASALNLGKPYSFQA